MEITLPIKTTCKSIFDKRYCVLLENIIALRKKNNITQRELAKILGVSNCYIARVETRERRLDLLETIDYLRALRLNDTEIASFLQIAIKHK